MAFFTRAVSVSNNETLARSTNGVYISTPGDLVVEMEGNTNYSNTALTTNVTFTSLASGFYNIKVKKIITCPPNTIGLY